ncbi:unnamed protein product [Heterobilharzia americana]|nr:unnamed protein product [Heterobilharzia americana]
MEIFMNPSPNLLRKIVRLQKIIADETKENSPVTPTKSNSPLKEAAKHFASEAERCKSAGNINECINLLKEAYICDPSDEIQTKIEQMKQASHPEDYTIYTSNAEVISGEEKLQDDGDTQSALVDKAKLFYQSGEYSECLHLLKKAYSIEPCDKIKRKIERIENYLKENGISTDQHCEPKQHINKNFANQLTGAHSDLIKIADGFSVPKLLYEKLYDYQKDGVHWLWSLHKKNSGGILADDMGLGKTVQVIAFLSGLFVSSRSCCTALIVMPVSVLVAWESELKRWAPTLRVMVFHDSSRSDRLKGLVSIQRHGGILLTTYGTLVSSVKDLSTDLNANPEFLRSKKSAYEADVDDILTRTGKEFHWTYLILDEAHKVKNPSAKMTKAAQAICADHCVLLTGTAVQNNLKELWSLYNVTHRGQLLGTQKTFSMEYDKPISRGREKDASRAEKVHGQLMAESLRRIIDPYFLRRTKAEVLSKNYNMNAVVPIKDVMPRKTEIVLWIYLSSIQESIYQDFLQLDHVKELLMNRTTRSPLMELIILKKICDHPRLLSTEQCLNLNLHYDDKNIDNNDNYHIDKVSHKIHFPPAEQLIKESGKFAFLHCLMKQFLKELQSNPQKDSPRTLIFSQSLKFLDMAEKVILNITCPMNDDLSNNDNNIKCLTKHRVLRLDGRTSKVCDRLNIINKFQNDKSYTVMLLTTQVGGVGLTITAANRVIILDPCWNPAVDAQAVDRAYRIGQKLDVVVYRLITCATVEEKIYRRQIFKDSVIRQTTAPGQNKTDLDPYRYFSRQELFELFRLGDTRVSETKRQLDLLHDGSDKWCDDSINPHLNFLCGDELKHAIYGLSFHDLMFSKESINDGPIDTDQEKLYVIGRRVAAERAIAEECAAEGRIINKEPSIIVGNTVQSLPTQTANPNLQIRFPPYSYNNNDNHHTDQALLNQLFKPSKADTHRPMFNRPITKQLNVKDTLMDNPQSICQTTADVSKIPVLTDTTLPYKYESRIPNVPVLNSRVEHRLNDQKYLVDSHGIGGSISPTVESHVQGTTKIPVAEECIEISNSSSEDDFDDDILNKPASGLGTHSNSTIDLINVDESIAQSLREMSITQTTPVKSNHMSDEKNSKELSIAKTSLHPPRSSLKSRSSMHFDKKFYRSTPISTKKATNIPPSKHFEQCDQNFDDSISDSAKSPGNHEYNAAQEYIHMDISVNMNDEDMANTVDMRSIQQVLAKSGLLNTTDVKEMREVEQSRSKFSSLDGSLQASVKETSDNSAPEENNFNKSPGGFEEVVMDSYVTNQSLDDTQNISQDIIEESDIVESSF